MRNNKLYGLLNGIGVTMFIVVILVLLPACSKGKRLHVDAIEDRSTYPVLDERDVTTLVSDSGVTRYRIQTHRWLVFDRAEQPYWEFPEGIYLEKFDEVLEVDAWLKADYAIYNEREQLWRLDRNVHAMNQEGERFDTQQLFWSQAQERVYSDSAITITREMSVIKGIGFVSNQTMTKYTILKPTGVFPVQDD